MRNLFLIFLIFPLTGLSQGITAPPGRAYQINTAGQDASGFVISGFQSQTLLTSIGLINPPAGTTFSLTTTTGLTRATGYTTWTSITRISFTGTQENINAALNSLKINTGATTGNVQLSISTTENPAGYYYNAVNGHFYRPISTTATYDNAKALSAAQTFKGQTGYLVTLTSANEESFVLTNVPQNNIWFALTDRTQEGFWRVDAGPENGTLIKTANGQLAGNISGQYNNWCGGEPNNAGDEDFAVTKWGGGNCWNDLPGSWSNPYIVEFGTWTNPADATFTNFYTANTINTVAITNTLSGTVSFTSLNHLPVLNLFRVVNGVETLVDYKTVSANGTYSFVLPQQNTTYKLVPSILTQGITMEDFNLIFNEVKNADSPNNTQSGLFLNSGKKIKCSDVNRNGVIDLGDAYSVIAHLTGLRQLNSSLWFTSTDYDSITNSNFLTINSPSGFTINATTVNLTLNLKFCVLGDANLSSSSQ